MGLKSTSTTESSRNVGGGKSGIAKELGNSSDADEGGDGTFEGPLNLCSSTKMSLQDMCIDCAAFIVWFGSLILEQLVGEAVRDLRSCLAVL